MVFNKKFLFILIFSNVFLLGLYKFHSNFLKKNHLEHIQTINKNIVQHVEDYDKLTTQIAKNSVIYYNKMYENGFRSLKDAIKMKNELEMDTFAMYDDDGDLEIDTDETLENHQDKEEYHNVYKKGTFNLFSSETSDYKKFKKHYPDVVWVSPFYLSKISNKVFKFAIIYNSKIKKFLLTEINRNKNIYNVLRNNALLHDEILYLKIMNPLYDMTSYSKKENYKPFLNRKKEYFHNEKERVFENKNVIAIETKCEALIQKESGREVLFNFAPGYNPKGEYFYVLTTEYSKEKLNKQLMFIRLLFATLFIIGNGIVFTLNNRKTG
jgi:hypothetical protein